MNERSMRRLNLVFRFVLEIVVLVALFMWGMSMSDDLPVQLLLGLAAPAFAMAVWGLFVAPKAARRLDDPARLILELVVFGAGVLAFVLAGQLLLGILLGTAAVISLGLMFYWGQRGY